MSTDDALVPAIRVDVWLWAARFFKTRGMAKLAITGGKVDVNDAGCKPARTLRVDDRLNIVRGEERLEVVVLAVSTRRGPASEAQLLYRETEASVARREAAVAQRRLGSTGMLRPPGRPDKHARRDLQRWKNQRPDEP